MSNATHLKGHAWLNFRRVHCGKWRYRNLILAGDAAHTAHFSIGLGHQAGLEDAIELADALNSGGATDEALEEYEQSRRLEVIKLQSAARNSTEWFENVPRYARFAPQQFNYSLLTRSQRVSHENLRLRDRNWLRRMERWYSRRATGSARAVAPMFVALPESRARNWPIGSWWRPMDMYSAVDGVVGDFHLVHLGSRAQGGAGLVFTEMSCVSEEGRITTGLRRNVPRRSRRRLSTHRGFHACPQPGAHRPADWPLRPKGSTRLMWEGMDQPLESGNWEVMGPSEHRFRRGGQTPRPMTRSDMDEGHRAIPACYPARADAGFDWLELHCAHGYLLSSFISPLSNRRRDQYGGTLKRRLRFPLEVLEAVRQIWPDHKPLSVRISATDWVKSGITGQDSGDNRPRHDRGRGGRHSCVRRPDVHPRPPVYGRMFQTPFSDLIRNEAGVPTIAVGNIYETDHVNSILAAAAPTCARLPGPT